MCDDHDEAADASHGGVYGGGMSSRPGFWFLSVSSSRPTPGVTGRRTQRWRGSGPPCMCIRPSPKAQASPRKLTGSAVFASMHSQVDTLVQLGADLCFFTDHDHIIALESGGMTPRLPRRGGPAVTRVDLLH